MDRAIWSDARARIERLRGLRPTEPHAWRAERCWNAAEVARFEKKHGGAVPAELRAWWTEIGSSGVGPSYGLFVPGTWSTGGAAKTWTSRQFGPLAKPFPYRARVETHRGGVPGAMPITDLGCGVTALLVTAGKQLGRIWLLEGRVLAPEGRFTFRGWIDAWLDEQERLVRETRPPTDPRDARDIVDAAELARWSRDLRERLERDGHAAVDDLGTLQRGNGVYYFDASAALTKAAAAEALSGSGLAARLFAAAIDGSEIDVPGLMRVRFRSAKPVEGRDYLGRTFRLPASRAAFLVYPSLGS